MARFVVEATLEAEQELATLLAHSPAALRRQITDASDRIDATLIHADLLPNYRRRRGQARTYTLMIFPLQGAYEIDNQAKVVSIFRYQLLPQLHRP